MRRVIHSSAAAFALVLPTLPAHADFYQLDGRFACLGQPRSVCYDATPSPDLPAAPTPATAAVAPRAPAASASVPPEASAATAEAALSVTRPRDPLIDIAARIKAKRPDAGDLAALQRMAAGRDPRALELLAWCALRGIGTDRDAVAAYFLYGEAAADAVPHAGANQAAVYTQNLTPEERQRVLEIEAKPKTARHDWLSANWIDGITRHGP